MIFFSFVHTSPNTADEPTFCITDGPVGTAGMLLLHFSGKFQPLVSLFFPVRERHVQRILMNNFVLKPVYQVAFIAFAKGRKV